MADTPTLEIIFGALFSEMRKAMMRALADMDLELSPPQTQLLVLIGEEPGVSAGALAKRTGRDKATVTRMLAPLLAAAWIERSPDPADARRQQLSLSVAGRENLTRVLSARRYAHEQVFRGLSEAEKTQLSALLQKCLPPVG
ncbi:MarR family transcriptional regulator [Microbulbifer sp. SAOS-129_SWC]|uniref:MarR family winged helix-turn-helix transcriptional regulator n=1 Tax=Microbulbifer sp. SAOS-129_SWC TaxID=3145235 RepID=UPI0032168478